MVRSLFLALLLGSCGDPAARTPVESNPPRDLPTTARNLIPRCDEPDPDARALASFPEADDLQGRFWVLARYDSQSAAWLPTTNTRMPAHHSSRIEWSNLVDFEQLATALSQQLRFTFRFEGREIVPVPSQDRWQATYRAFVLAICSASAESARAVGSILAPIPSSVEDCGPYREAVLRAAAEATRCTRSDECEIRAIGVCNIEGLGCYWTAANRNARPEPLAGAIDAMLRSGACPIAECDCQRPPEHALCEQDRCLAGQ